MKQRWEIKKVSEISKTSAGGTPRKSHKEYYDNGDIPWLQSGEVGTRNIQKSKNFITQTGLKNSSAKIFPKGTVLIAMYGATAGEVGILNFKAATNQAVCGILPSKQLLKDFTYYFFLYHKKKLILQAVGNAQPNISQEKIKNTLIPVPSIQEQKQIVTILDEAFAAIAKAKSNAEQNLKNAKELFESYLQGVFENIKTGEQLYPLAKYLDLITYGFTNPMPTAYDGPYMVTAKNVKGGVVDYVTSRRTSQKAFDTLLTDKSRPRKGDVLLTKDGTLGRLAVVEKEDMCINQSVALLRTNKELDPYYLKELLSSRFYQRLMVEQAGGTTIKHIYITRVDKMLVPIPSLKSQHDIVKKINLLSGKTKKLESIYLSKINDLEELKKSILQKAFSGELTKAEFCYD